MLEIVNVLLLIIGATDFSEAVKRNREFDYVIIGGGTSGCILASRLSEDPDVSVIVLEAGKDPVDDALVRVPFTTNTVKYHLEYDWRFFTEPQKNSAKKEKQEWLAQSKLLGGCHSHNGLAYVRGSRHNYDRWEQHGNTGWDYKSVLPFFKMAEDMTDPTLAKTVYHGTDGPLQVRVPHTVPIVQELFKANEELGFKVNEDFNGEELEGIGNNWLTINSRGERLSTLEGFLRPVMARRNLRVKTRAYVTKIEIKKNTKKQLRATGVFYMKKGKKRFVKARKEVLVSAGVFNSPKILQLSGIGPKNHLEHHKINVLANLPVGKSLTDHIGVSFMVQVKKTTPVEMKKIHTFENLFKYLFTGTGPYATNGFTALAFYSIDGQPKTDLFPYIEHMIGSGDLSLMGKFQPLRDSIRNGSGIIPDLVKDIPKEDKGHETFHYIPVHLHPKVKGQVMLRSTDPLEPPKIELEYLESDQDVKQLIEGIRIILDVLNTKTMRTAQVHLVKPDKNCKLHKFNTDKYWECYIRHNFFPFLHFTSSCKMGNDSTAVVDDHLRVKGVSGLRVVDCSIMPSLPSGHTMAAATMIAEKAAYMIRTPGSH